jgi:hypothetical protein
MYQYRSKQKHIPVLKSYLYIVIVESYKYNDFFIYYIFKGVVIRGPSIFILSEMKPMYEKLSSNVINWGQLFSDPILRQGIIIFQNDRSELVVFENF